jgi:cytidine deaminase
MVSTIERNGIEVVRFEAVQDYLKPWLLRARRGLRYSYNPLLRRWKVSVTLETKRNGSIRFYPGVNREINPQLIECGEENALGNADSAGRGEYCTGMIIVGRRIDVDDDIPRIITPCDNSRVAIKLYAERSGIGGSFWFLLVPEDYEHNNMMLTTFDYLPPFDVEGIDARCL